MWGEYIKVNSEIIIRVHIVELCPVLREWGKLEKELSFDCIRLHMHHADKMASSHTLRYHPHHNLYHISQLVDKRVLKSGRAI